MSTKKETSAEETKEEKTEEKAEEKTEEKVEEKTDSKKEKKAKKESKKESEIKEAAEKLISAEKEKYLRLCAEYDNYRKRSQKERESLYADIKADTLLKFLPVYDNLERALAQPTADEAYRKGVEMIMTQFNTTLEKLGITEIEAMGQTFDPNIHNAVMHIEDESFGENLQTSINVVYQTMAQMPAYVEHVANLPGFSFNLIFTTLSVARNFNGLYILPILSAVSQYLMTVLQPTTPTPAANDGKGQSGQGANAFMKWFFPLFSLWICSTSNASFSLYWVTSNLIAMVQTFAINKYLDMKEKKTETIGEGTVK